MPVPVNQWRLNNPRFGMMAVAAAGPGTNLVLAAIGAVLLSVAIQLLALFGVVFWPGLALWLPEVMDRFQGF